MFQRPRFSILRGAAAVSTLILTGAAVSAGLTPIPPGTRPSPPVQDAINGQNFPDETGTFSTISLTGRVDTGNPFFKSLGSNGRACVNCHQPKTGWSITPTSAQAVFDATGGLDPLFRTVDGANSPEADVSTLAARQQAYSMLLTKGVIRVHLPIPAHAEFSLLAVDDPYGHASAADLSLFRRPLPTANLPFLSTVMWDARQTASAQSIPEDLISQAADAIQNHAQAMTGQAIPYSTLRSLVLFETQLFTAQTSDDNAGALDAAGATGGPLPLPRQLFFPGINDPLGLNPSGRSFDSSVFGMYSAWLPAQRSALPGNHDSGPGDRDGGPPTQGPPQQGPSPRGSGPGQPFGPPAPRDPPVSAATAAARASVARGEALFNTKSFLITGVPGLNDVYGKPVIQGTCTTCHDSPGAGTHSVPLMVNLGLADGSRRTADMPLYTLVNTTTGEMTETTDPGFALVSGKWADIGKFKVPDLRALESRSPYFHNGSTGSLPDLVDFYDTRFGIGFTTQEKADLVAFLPTL